MPVYAHHALLEAVPDLFCAEAIWQAPGFALFARRPLLRDLLERHPREQRGRAATRCFAHVVIALPQEEIDDDYHLARGARARELEQALEALHQRDFADLLAGETVRYQVLGSEQVPPGAADVRFGHAVYLPGPGEKIAFSASISRDGAVWRPVCPVYQGQRLALLGAGADLPAGPSQPQWPLGADGAILLLNDGPGTQPVIQVRPRDAYECRFEAAHGHYAIRARRGDAHGSLLLRISDPAPDPARIAASALPSSGPLIRTQPGPTAAAPVPRPSGAAMHAVWQPRPASGLPALPAQLGAAPRGEAAGPRQQSGMEQRQPAAAQRTRHVAAAGAPDTPWPAAPQPAGGDATALPMPASHPAAVPAADCCDATYVPAARQRVILAALALPRLSRYRATGARQLDIPLAPDDRVTLTIDAEDGLHALAAGGRHAVATPATLPHSGGAIHVLPPPPAMADRYCALLPLAQLTSVHLPLAGRHRFGRQSAALAPLRLLDSPRLLHGDGAPASADRFGLSREAFSFEMSPQGVRIIRLAASQALYHLDSQLQFVAAIGAAAEAAPYLLPPGHHVAAGHYVLRFDA